MQVKKIRDYRSYEIKDFEVVNRVLHGEKELYEILLRRYNQTLYRAVRSYVQDENEVADVMQETYLKAFEKLHQFRKEASFSTWLIRIGINEALMQLRAKKSQPQHESAYTPSNRTLIDQLADVNKMNPEKKAIQKETRYFLEQAIDLLPEKYRSVYMLREVEGLSNSEAATCLQISENNTKVRLYRAKTLLKEKLYDLTDRTKIYEFGNNRCDELVSRVMSRI